MHNFLLRHWYYPGKRWFAWLLWPFALMFGCIIKLRRWLYQHNIFTVQRMSVPVIVVGNLTIGGTGKTPAILTLAKQLSANGYKPGIILRGYKGKKHVFPHLVSAADTANEVGDEACLMRKHSDCPIVVCTKRGLAAQYLSKQCACDVILSDDGLQHYALGRDIEIVVIDNQRGLGNKTLLPAGPLREPLQRLKSVDFIIYNYSTEQLPPRPAPNTYSMSLQPVGFYNLSDHKFLPTNAFATLKVHAVAGIGNPQRFFDTLKNLQINYEAHALADHYLYKADSLDFSPTLPIIMTEKDAVKCDSFAKANWWYLQVAATLEDRLIKELITKINSLTRYKNAQNLASHCPDHAHPE